jgi:hypothetical protein
MSAIDTSSTGLRAFLSPRMAQSTVLPVIWQQASAPERSRSHLDSAPEYLGRAELSPAASTELTALFDRIVNRTP